MEPFLPRKLLQTAKSACVAFAFCVCWESEKDLNIYNSKTQTVAIFTIVIASAVFFIFFVKYYKVRVTRVLFISLRHIYYLINSKIQKRNVFAEQSANMHCTSSYD